MNQMMNQIMSKKMMNLNQIIRKKKQKKTKKLKN